MLHRFFSRKVLCRWLMAAMLLQSLLPALAGVRAGDNARWMEVCASSGVKWVKVMEAGGTADGHSGGDHCVLCATTGAAPEFDVRRHLPEASGPERSSATDRPLIPILSASQHHARAPPR